MTNGPTERQSFDHAAWALLAFVMLLIGALEAYRPLRIDALSCGPFIAACAPLAGASYYYARVRPNPAFAMMCLGLLQVLLFSAIGSVLSYLLAREGGQFWDATFMAWDKSAGLDWLSFVRAMDRLPWLTVPLYWAYVSLIPQVVALVLLLGFSGQPRPLRRFMLAAMLCGAITILASPFFPSVSAYVYLGLGQAQFHHIDVMPGYAQVMDVTALRTGTMTRIILPQMQGIIAFPSYHAGLAAVIFWSWWSSGRGLLRWPGCIAAAATIISAPIHGGHYFVDVVAGLGIAAVSILVAERAIGWNAATLLPRFNGWSRRAAFQFAQGSARQL
jgi:hypothetical protein